MRHWLYLAVALSLACNGGPGGGGDEEEALPSPYADSGEPEQEPPLLSAEQVTGSAMAGLTAFVGLQPDGVIDAFEALALFEPDCPEEQEVGGEGENVTMIWYSEGCTTSAGLTIRGGGRFERFTVEDGDRTGSGAALSSEGSNLRLSHSDGRSFETNGYVYYERAASPDGFDSIFEVNGDFSADAATAAASPLLSGTVSAQGLIYSFYGEGFAGLAGSGSLSGEVLGEALAFQFTNMLLLPIGCAAEPAGTLSVRDGAGYWHDVVFDTATFDEQEEPQFDAALCNGCGMYLAAGEVLGEACVDAAAVSGLMQWEEYPW